jgi:dienelactone hydrolase
MADVVVFHSVLGLRSVELAFADRLRAAGHRVTIPDPYAGQTTSSMEEGFALKDAVGWETITRRAFDAVRERPAEAVLAGVSMGAGVVQEVLPHRLGTSGVLMLHAVGAVPAGIRAGLPVQVHVADPDPIAPPEQVAAWREGAVSAGADARVFTYPGIGHFYTDADGPEYDAAAAELTWDRVLEFLSRS